MTNQHPITPPPPELVKQWLAEPEYVSGWNGKCTMISVTDHRFSNICAKAAQWGADQELEACCKWLPKLPPWSADDLRRHRRPKPSLKEQALSELNLTADPDGAELSRTQVELIRKALEALDD